MMNILTTLEHVENPCMNAYLSMHEIEIQEIVQALLEHRAVGQMKMYMCSGPDRNRYNEPIVDEVAAIFVRDKGASPSQFDFATYTSDGQISTIPTNSPHCDPKYTMYIF